MIDFQQVDKQFGAQAVLRGVSFRIHPGERVGIVGPNGAGKSTLFALMTGQLTPDRGTISVPGSARFGHVRQQLRPREVAVSAVAYAQDAVAELGDIRAQIDELEGLLARGSGEETESRLERLGRLQTRFEHMGGYELRTRAERALSGLGFRDAALAIPFRSLSGGWQMRAELARVLVAQPDILLLDEPTNFLDVPATEWLTDFLRNYAGTLVLISHDRYVLNSVATVTLETMAGSVTRYPGTYDWYVREREQRHQRRAAEQRNLARRRQQVERFVERFRAKNTKSSQVQSRVKMLEKLPAPAPELPRVVAPSIRLPAPPHCGEEVMSLEDLGVTYDGARWVFRHVGLRLERGEKLGVVGVNGMGKTTLLRIMAGVREPSEGSRRTGHGVAVAYHAQDAAESMDPSQSVFLTARGAAPDLSEQELRNILGAFGFSGDAIEKPVDVLSGGEKVRLGIARLLLKRPNLLILDEPTTHLDVRSREALEAALKAYRGTVCLVSHDIEFLRHLADAIVEISAQGVVRYYGGYDYYREKRAEAPDADQSSVASAAEGGKARQGKLRRREEAERRRLLYERRRPLQEQVGAAEDKVEALERERDDLLVALSAGPAANEYPDLSRRLVRVQRELEQTTEQWERAAIALEELAVEDDSFSEGA